MLSYNAYISLVSSYLVCSTIQNPTINRNRPDMLRQLVVALVPIRVQPAREAFQEGLRMLRFLGGLVLIQHNRLFRAAAGAVKKLDEIERRDAFRK